MTASERLPDALPPVGLSDKGQERLARALRLAAALEALVELRALLDPDGIRARWAVAGQIDRLLYDFGQVAHPRIASGGRAPRGRLEELLFVIAESDLPRSDRKIHDLLA